MPGLQLGRRAYMNVTPTVFIDRESQEFQDFLRQLYPNGATTREVIFKSIETAFLTLALPDFLKPTQTHQNPLKVFIYRIIHQQNPQGFQGQYYAIWSGHETIRGYLEEILFALRKLPDHRQTELLRQGFSNTYLNLNCPQGTISRLSEMRETAVRGEGIHNVLAAFRQDLAIQIAGELVPRTATETIGTVDIESINILNREGFCVPEKVSGFNNDTNSNRLNLDTVIRLFKEHYTVERIIEHLRANYFQPILDRPIVLTEEESQDRKSMLSKCYATQYDQFFKIFVDAGILTKDQLIEAYYKQENQLITSDDPFGDDPSVKSTTVLEEIGLIFQPEALQNQLDDLITRLLVSQGIVFNTDLNPCSKPDPGQLTLMLLANRFIKPENDQSYSAQLERHPDFIKFAQAQKENIVLKLAAGWYSLRQGKLEAHSLLLEMFFETGDSDERKQLHDFCTQKRIDLFEWVMVDYVRRDFQANAVPIHYFKNIEWLLNLNRVHIDSLESLTYEVQKGFTREGVEQKSDNGVITRKLKYTPKWIEKSLLPVLFYKAITQNYPSLLLKIIHSPSLMKKLVDIQFEDEACSGTQLMLRRPEVFGLLSDKQVTSLCATSKEAMDDMTLANVIKRSLKPDLQNKALKKKITEEVEHRKADPNNMIALLTDSQVMGNLFTQQVITVAEGLKYLPAAKDEAATQSFLLNLVKTVPIENIYNGLEPQHKEYIFINRPELGSQIPLDQLLGDMIDHDFHNEALVTVLFQHPDLRMTRLEIDSSKKAIVIQWFSEGSTDFIRDHLKLVLNQGDDLGFFRGASQEERMGYLRTIFQHKPQALLIAISDDTNLPFFLSDYFDLLKELFDQHPPTVEALVWYIQIMANNPYHVSQAKKLSPLLVSSMSKFSAINLERFYWSCVNDSVNGNYLTAFIIFESALQFYRVINIFHEKACYGRAFVSIVSDAILSPDAKNVIADAKNVIYPESSTFFDRTFNKLTSNQIETMMQEVLSSQADLDKYGYLFSLYFTPNREKLVGLKLPPLLIKLLFNLGLPVIESIKQLDTVALIEFLEDPRSYKQLVQHHSEICREVLKNLDSLSDGILDNIKKWGPHDFFIEELKTIDPTNTTKICELLVMLEQNISELNAEEQAVFKQTFETVAAGNAPLSDEVLAMLAQGDFIKRKQANHYLVNHLARQLGRLPKFFETLVQRLKVDSSVLHESTIDVLWPKLGSQEEPVVLTPLVPLINQIAQHRRYLDPLIHWLTQQSGHEINKSWSWYESLVPAVRRKLMMEPNLQDLSDAIRNNYTADYLDGPYSPFCKIACCDGVGVATKLKLNDERPLLNLLNPYMANHFPPNAWDYARKEGLNRAAEFITKKIEGPNWPQISNSALWRAPWLFQVSSENLFKLFANGKYYNDTAASILHHLPCSTVRKLFDHCCSLNGPEDYLPTLSVALINKMNVRQLKAFKQDDSEKHAKLFLGAALRLSDIMNSEVKGYVIRALMKEIQFNTMMGNTDVYSRMWRTAKDGIKKLVMHAVTSPIPYDTEPEFLSICCDKSRVYGLSYGTLKSHAKIYINNSNLSIETFIPDPKRSIHGYGHVLCRLYEAGDWSLAVQLSQTIITKNQINTYPHPLDVLISLVVNGELDKIRSSRIFNQLKKYMARYGRVDRGQRSWRRGILRWWMGVRLFFLRWVNQKGKNDKKFQTLRNNLIEQTLDAILPVRFWDETSAPKYRDYFLLACQANGEEALAEQLRASWDDKLYKYSKDANVHYSMSIKIDSMSPTDSNNQLNCLLLGVENYDGPIGEGGRLRASHAALDRFYHNNSPDLRYTPDALLERKKKLFVAFTQKLIDRLDCIDGEITTLETTLFSQQAMMDRLFHELNRSGNPYRCRGYATLILNAHRIRLTGQNAGAFANQLWTALESRLDMSDDQTSNRQAAVEQLLDLYLHPFAEFHDKADFRQRLLSLLPSYKHIDIPHALPSEDRGYIVAGICDRNEFAVNSFGGKFIRKQLTLMLDPEANLLVRLKRYVVDHANNDEAKRLLKDAFIKYFREIPYGNYSNTRLKVNLKEVMLFFGEDESLHRCWLCRIEDLSIEEVTDALRQYDFHTLGYYYAEYAQEKHWLGEIQATLKAEQSPKAQLLKDFFPEGDRMSVQRHIEDDLGHDGFSPAAPTMH